MEVKKKNTDTRGRICLKCHSPWQQAGAFSDDDDIGFPGKIRKHTKLSSTKSRSVFVGEFSGYTYKQKEKIPVTLSLSESQGVFSGQGILFGKDGLVLHIKDGQVEKDTLIFVWDMGRNYFGIGKLIRGKSGKFTGAWWTKQNSSKKPIGLFELAAVQ
jgi:hypothetical protein